MTNPNDPAFSSDFLDASTPIGLTKREYFAAQALRGAIDWHSQHNDPRQTDIKAIASDCVAMADALIAELSKEAPANE